MEQKAVWQTDKKYSRGQIVKFCNQCDDTSFELLENKERTGKCCRCGKEMFRPKEVKKHGGH